MLFARLGSRGQNSFIIVFMEWDAVINCQLNLLKVLIYMYKSSHAKNIPETNSY